MIKYTTVAQEGEIREWSTGKFQKVDGKWIPYKEHKVHFTYKGSKFKPSIVPKSFSNLLPDQFFDKLGKKPYIIFSNKREFNSYFDPNNNKIYLSSKRNWYGSLMYIHELGHYFAENKKIVTPDFVNSKFKDLANSMKEEFKTTFPKMLKVSLRGIGSEGDIERGLALIDKLKASYPTINNLENKIMPILDIIAGMTGLEYGFGHSIEYWNEEPNNYEAELFAHGTTFYFGENELFDLFFPKSSAKLINFYDGIFN